MTSTRSDTARDLPGSLRRSETRRRVSPRAYRLALVAIAAVFTLAFVVLVIPALVADGGDVMGGLADGFVNPYASGYSWDVFCTWAVLAVWVGYERATLGQRHGWISLVLGLAPGVAVGLASYLLLRSLRPPTGAEVPEREASAPEA